ncbi:hypothetical protein EIN_144470, partial [Entamoeba invadens IP1]
MSNYFKRCIEQRNMQTSLECCLPALLSQKGTLKIANPQKKTTYSSEFIKLTQLTFNDVEEWTLDIINVVKERCRDIEKFMLMSGVSKGTAYRRSMDAKRREFMHLIEDILFVEGYDITYTSENREGISGDVKIR